MSQLRIDGKFNFGKQILEAKGYSSLEDKFTLPVAKITANESHFFYVKKEKSDIALHYSKGQELLATGFALETLLSGSEIDFAYARSLPERFANGRQGAIAKKKILVVGCGGIGSNACIALSEYNVPFTVIDFDTIEEHNIQAQPFFKQYVGKKKTEAIASLTGCKSIEGKIEDYAPLLEQHDTILSCVDNWQTRFFINKFANKHNKTILNASVTNTTAEIAYLKGLCLRCVYKPAGDGKTSCHELQNVFAMNYIAGALAAEEAISDALPQKNSIAIVNNRKRIYGYLQERGGACAC